MILSLIVAIFIPFKLFLFSYAVLGPLHYLTEINWLREKKYFMLADRKHTIIFIVIAILVSISPSIRYLDLQLAPSIQSILVIISRYNSAFLISSFLFAIGLLFYKKTRTLLILLVVVSLISFISTNYLHSTFIYVSIFLPTLIHVYLFTLMFVLFGSIKSKSKIGISSVIVLAIIPFVIWYLPIEIVQIAKPSSELLNIFVNSSFVNLNIMLAKVFKGLENGRFVLLSEIGLRIQIFIAFAYTYHYLNWLSKTSVIGWGKTLSKQKVIWMLVIYAFSLGLYFYDYKTGLTGLFFLSYLHVLLEFPLNAFTVKGLISEVIGNFKKNSF